MNILNNLFIEEKEGWFTLRGWEGLFHVDLETGVCNCEGDIIKENKFKDIVAMVKYRNYILILPTGKNDSLDIYDVQTKKYVHHLKLDLEGMCCFDNAVVREKYIFLVNNWSTNPSVYVLDMDSINITEKIFINGKLLWKYDDAGRVFSKDIIVENDILVLGSSAERYIINVDLCNYTVKYINIPCKLNGFVTICSDGKNYWLTDENALVIKWNPEDKEEKYDLKKIADLDIDLSEQDLRYKKNSHGYRASYMYFNSTIHKDGKIFWIPGRANKLLMLDIFSGQWSTIYVRPEIQGYTSWLIYPNIKEDYIYFFSLREQKLLKIDSVIREMDFNFIIKDKTIIMQDGLWHEGDYLMPTFNEFLNNNFVNDEFQIKKSDTYGRTIWNMFTR